jgi:hypothetical protein
MLVLNGIGHRALVKGLLAWLIELGIEIKAKHLASPPEVLIASGSHPGIVLGHHIDDTGFRMSFGRCPEVRIYDTDEAAQFMTDILAIAQPRKSAANRQKLLGEANLRAQDFFNDLVNEPYLPEWAKAEKPKKSKKSKKVLAGFDPDKASDIRRPGRRYTPSWSPCARFTHD